MHWTYLIGGASLFIGLLALLFKLILDRKEATIQTLNTNISWLQQQLKEAQNNSPDARAERLLKNIATLEKEIEILSRDQVKNEKTIAEKIEELETTNEEVKTLRGEIERANELLEEATYYKEQFGCPYCGAELTTLAGEEDEYRIYACGYSISPETSHPCPYDPEFPKFDEYELEIKKLSSGRFFCQPKAKTKNAYKLNLQMASGDSEEEVKQKIIKNYERFLPKRLQERSR